MESSRRSLSIVISPRRFCLYGQRLDAATMTTGGCCHLPGSLCDCSGTGGMWKIVEEAGGEGCQALYVTQVTALDGRLLSSVLKPMSVQR